ncbi:hypothetical protein SRHO_G00174950 [Serrasalmus rhombeus]
MPEGLSEVKLEDLFEFLLVSAAESSPFHVVDGAALVVEMQCVSSEDEGADSQQHIACSWMTTASCVPLLSTV